MHEIATEFTPWTGLLGGALIGLASSLLMLANGRIAGISGILGPSLFPSQGDLVWRLAFLVGLPLGAGIVQQLSADLHGFAITPRLGVLIAGGLLVGFGTQLGNGCTSGHGVCGLARGSRRSLVATLVFMASGVGTVFIMRHVVGAP
jgi:uncharacterized membrane protein YedE/YeeE